MKVKLYNDWVEYLYKDARIVVIDEADRLIIRVANQYGFTWFETLSKEEKYRKIKQAYEIEREKSLHPFGKYAFIDFINLN